MSQQGMATQATGAFRAERDGLLTHRTDYATAMATFRWPHLPEFNWALEWFDVVAAEHPERLALWVVSDDAPDITVTYAAMARRSAQVANWLRGHGVKRGDSVLLMLDNQVELWETMLAVMKLGAVLIPSSTLLTPEDLADRLDRGSVRHVVTGQAYAKKLDGLAGEWTKVVVGDAPGWLAYRDADSAPEDFTPDGPTRTDDPLFLYFTSGTTSKPKLVEHTYGSYPIGHLSTMYWIGLRPGDVHLNISSPGWAKHAWSNMFAPWNAEATVFIYNYTRFAAAPLLDQLVRCKVDTFCAPPTVWRMLIQADLAKWQVPTRELVAAGEPLNPEVIEQVSRAWGITIRDGYGQTETTAQVGNSPGQPLRLGSMGRPLPGYRIALVDPITEQEAAEGEICLDLSARPIALMRGYQDSPERTAEVMRNGFYHTGDVASRDADGYITYVGRADDVFKASDYRISPFELESVLLEHPAVAEAAVVPSPDPLRLAVPKAYVVLAAGFAPDADTALAILRYAREHLSAYKRVRRLEFAELPKTISGKIRRVDLRGQEVRKYAGTQARPAGEYRDDDFPSLRGDPSL
ncbi:MAG TPA: AMP-binding protein [Ktedonobacterales bacterium]